MWPVRAVDRKIPPPLSQNHKTSVCSSATVPLAFASPRHPMDDGPIRSLSGGGALPCVGIHMHVLYKYRQGPAEPFFHRGVRLLFATTRARSQLKKPCTSCSSNITACILTFLASRRRYEATQIIPYSDHVSGRTRTSPERSVTTVLQTTEWTRPNDRSPPPVCSYVGKYLR